MNDDWYYSTGNGDTNGPVLSAELLEAAKRGILTASGMVYHIEKTNGQWMNSTDIPAISSAIEGRSAILGKRNTQMPPPPTAAPSIKVGESFLARPKTLQVERLAGIVGVMSLVFGFVLTYFFGSVYEPTRNGVYNIGLQQNRQIGFFLGLAVAQMGWVTILFLINRAYPTKTN